MPIIQESSYKKGPWYYFNAYLETLGPYLWGRRPEVAFDRERLELSDGDFLDLDWLIKGADSLIIISHGMEGNSRDHFIAESASFLSISNDILVWHYRSCSGELNRLPRFYHSGDIADLDTVVHHAISTQRYTNLILLGFSIGGSLTINYLGSQFVHTSIRGGVVFSTPLDLLATSNKLRSGINRYLHRAFLNKWKKKIKSKAAQFPDRFSTEGLDDILRLDALLEKYVLQVDGFDTKEEYYEKWSSAQFLSAIQVPLLIVNAQNDPLISPECFPYQECASSEYVFLETPKYGGHTGFSKKKEGLPWYVFRINDFVQKLVT